MSLSPLVDEHYTLKPVDVGRAPLRVTINNVSLQGVEEISPVLHLNEFPTKRLVIDSTQSQTLIQMTGSPLFASWIGHKIDLKVVTQAGLTHIVLSAPQPENWLWPRTSTALPDRTRRQYGPSILLFIVLLFIFSAAYLLDNGDAIWQFLKNFIPL
ncbi:MAG: hypothetical protein NT075_22530 [Chloroflexi bacterium]|nr:hypothetical protein [Chloroflexota bacterium]